MARVFVAGGTGFIGAELVRRLVAEGHRVEALARTRAGAAAASALGAAPVAGDLAAAGPWQRAAAAAHWVVHLAQPQTFGGRVTRARAEAYRAGRLAMDRHLLGALSPGTVERIVYVGGTSYYGEQGRTPRGEEASPRPRGWGPYLAPAIAALDGPLGRGLPLVLAFPGYVYGVGSWFREYVLRPLRAGLRLTTLVRPRVTSPIHVRDCARALAHLLVRGEIGRRYFVVDDRPAPMDELYRLAAEAMGVPLRVRRVPAPLVRLLLGPVVTDSLLCDCALSNARLRGLGFVPELPTITEGVPEVARAYLAARAARATTGGA